MTSSEDLLHQLIAKLESFDKAGFQAAVDDATNSMSIPEVFDLLLAPAQRWVGAQWETGVWNVAQEHLATTITQRAVDNLQSDDAHTNGGPVLVTCAEGEWHTLGLSMVSVGLQSQGYKTVSLSGPLPAGQLLPFLHELAPRCVTVSCQMPGNLPGARRMVATALEAGTPAIVGGSGLTAKRANHLGATGYASEIQGLSQVIEAVQPAVKPIEPLTHQRWAGFEWLDMHIHSLAANLAKATQGLTTEAALEGVWMLRALNAALLCDEPRILRDQSVWQANRSSLGDGPPLPGLIRALRTVISPGPPIVVQTVDEAASDLLD